MRLVKIQMPEGKANEIVRIAFDAGVHQVTVRQEQIVRPGQPRLNRDVVDVEVATPTAKTLIDAVLAAPFYDPREYAITVREPRAIVSREPPKKLTWPLTVPTPDLQEELWQFSHVTSGFVGRVLIAAMLLAYGMIENKILIIIAGLLFLPALPLLLALSLGIRCREWRLARQGATALATALIVTIIGGALVGWLVGPPMRFTDFGSPLVSLIISLVVGFAAGLAMIDDTGRRELIGLAAAAQISLPTAWFGVSLAFGTPAGDGAPLAQRALSLLLTLVAIVVAALVAYTLVGMWGAPARRSAARPALENEKE